MAQPEARHVPRRGAARRRLPRSLTSLSNRIALVFFAITLLAIAGLYIYVAPGLQSRLVNAKLTELASAAQNDSKPMAIALRQHVSQARLRARLQPRVARASKVSGARVTVLAPTPPSSPDRLQLIPLADSSLPTADNVLDFAAAVQAERTGLPATATEVTAGGGVAEAAIPIRNHRRVVGAVLYSAPISDIVRSVDTVRHEILVAGGLALALALICGLLTARWLGRRVRRLERAAERVAAGDFEDPIPVDSSDELGQLALAFNDMQRQLSQLDSARKKFIATASHELRTPIFSLGGFVELLEDDELDAETRRRFLDQVSEQVERLRKLSVDLLDLSRLESGSLELHDEPVDLCELTRSVSAEFEPSLAQHDSHLEVRLAGPLETQCDPVRVAQIVRILIDNAVTHTPTGTKIVVAAERENGHLRLAVRDNGQGIDAGALSRIFEPFYTADGTQGAGLGLTIASELAERMDGRLTADSSAGQTVFTLEIPARVAGI